MSDKAKPPSNASSNASKSKAPTYISSGQTLDAIPLGVRVNRAVDDIYNFLGLYFTSLIALDPHAAAHNSRFNTRGPGRGTGTTRAASNPSGNSGLYGGGRLGGGSGGGNGPRGGGGGGGNVRRMGTVDDVRVPPCGSCG